MLARRASGALLTLILAAAAATAGPVAPAELAGRAAGADVVIAGETHDNEIHHDIQAALAAALDTRAIVFEMMTPDQAAILARARADGADTAAQASAIDWAESGWPDYAWYARILDAAPAAAIVGGALPRGEVRRAVGEGAAAVFGADARLYGLTAALPEPELEARIALQAEAHCDMLPAELLPGMVEAQRLRDAALARATVAALDLPGDGPVLVITGTGHARTDWGIPASLAFASPETAVYAYALLEAEPAEPVPFDAWHVTEPAERPDPCESLRQG